MVMKNKLMDYEAKILIEALPYIKKYYDKTIVVKYGGNAMNSVDLEEAVIKDLILLTAVGINVVLIHGGGTDITELLEKLKMKTKFVDGIRYTDRETIDIVKMVLCGKINKNLVALINKNGGKAAGFCGLDGSMITVIRKEGRQDLGFVGDIVSVDTELLETIIGKKFIPVISGMGMDKEGQIYNINSDTVAAFVAGALKAERLIFMTDQRGVMRDKREKSLIEWIEVNEIPGLIQSGVIKGGMIPKIRSCVKSMEEGVKRTVIIDGRLPHAILMELFSDKGIGTMIYKG